MQITYRRIPKFWYPDQRIWISYSTYYHYEHDLLNSVPKTTEKLISKDIPQNSAGFLYKKYSLGPNDVIAKIMGRACGSYALELMFRDYLSGIRGHVRIY